MTKAENDRMETPDDHVGLSHRTAGRTGSVRRAAWLGVLMLAVGAAVLATYWPVLSVNSLFFDDMMYLTDNPLVQNPSWSSAKRFLCEVAKPSTVQGYYQPLTMISLMLDYARGGRPEHLRPFHQTNLGLHVLNCLLMTGLVYLVFGNPWVAAMVGLLFGVHPLTVEPVAWMSERKTMLATVFSLGAMVSYVRYVRRSHVGYYVACAVLYVLALMSKPTATMLPVVLILLDYWPLGRLNRRAIMEKVPLLLISGISAVITVVSQGRAAGVRMPHQYGPAEIPLMLCHNIVFYLRKIIYPSNLSAFYPFPEPFDLTDPNVLVGVIGTGVWIGVLLLSWRRTRGLLVGWLIFFVTILPTMGVIGFTQFIASDKYVYLPSVGLLLVLAWFLRTMWHHPAARPSLAWPQIGSLLAVLVIAGAEARATRRYLAHWQNEESIFRYMLRLYPQRAALLNGLGRALADQGRLDEAAEAFTAALRVEPASPVVLNNLAAVLARQGQVEQAVRYYRQALQSDDTSATAHQNLGALLLKLGRTDQAVEHLDRAVRLNPNHVRAHFNLGIALNRLGRTDQAAAHYREAVQLDPRLVEGHNNLAIVLIKLGQTDQAIHHFTEAIRIHPGFVNARKNLASALASQGRIEQAIEEYRQVLRVQPRDADAHCAMGDLLSRQGKTDQAIAAYREALAVAPDHAVARQRLSTTQGKHAGQ